jgi:hypothetical protein
MPLGGKTSGTTRRATDDERGFKFHHFRGVARVLEVVQHRLHGPLAHLVVRLIDCCQRRIVPLGDGDVVIADHSHVLRDASVEFFEFGNSTDSRHVVGCDDGRGRRRELHQASGSVSTLLNVLTAGNEQLG